MNILITGAQGQLGKDLEQVLLSAGTNEVICLGRSELDVIRSQEVMQVILAARPQVIIHAAVNTNVDHCELDKDSAYLVNSLGTRNVAVAAAKVEAKLVYVSTDYVFDGQATKSYTEFDPPHPISIYGKSKLAGGKYIAGFSNKYFIVRTSWLYGYYGKNFVKTMLSMLSLVKEKGEANVVNDQVGSPTYTKDLAGFLVHLMQTELYGIYHATNSGECSWFDFARTIFKKAGLDYVKLRPISTIELNRPAPRPAYSVLNNYCLKLQGLPGLRPWEEALEEFLAEYFS